MTLDQAFPEVNPGVRPCGARVIVQMKSLRKFSAGGIELPPETQDERKWNGQTGKVVAIGPIAFCNRETGKPWNEGVWAELGDFVRVPRWGGDRWEVQIPGVQEKALFVTFNDHEVIGVITGDPLEIENYIL